MRINIATQWTMVFILEEELTEAIIEWLQDNAYPITDSDRDVIYDVRTCLDEGVPEEIKPLQELIDGKTIGYIKVIDESNY